MNGFSPVRVWEASVTIPTYEIAPADKNPLFLEKRVYQGSSGKVYPHPVVDKIADEKTLKAYQAVWLENDFLKIMILPCLGGRVQRAFDKTRNYDFVYYNRVIKPALVGLAGPWISGGIEFNWPQHHRPSTFDPVNYTFRENPDGSASVTVSEYENMFHTKGETEFTLYPDKAYLELSNRLYNRTPVNQTFLWWANPAVAVNASFHSVFPPDVTAVCDHGKRDVSTFPIATGVYYKVDYSRGVDISRYENLPVPTSYMAAKSDFDFVGGYDESVGAGLLHVADHHVSPGKKQWTWGNGDFGRAWDRNLTDEDGPYFELMTGCFTDNQPDFGYIAPFETREFKQYFMPYHDLGTVHNAGKDLSLRLDVTEEEIRATLYSSGVNGKAEVRINGETVAECILRTAETASAAFPNDKRLSFDQVKIEIVKDGRVLLSFDGNVKKQEIPSPAEAAPLPEECRTVEDLYLYGVHVEQYRHATRRAGDYFREGLRRDPTDLRLNNAMGLLLFKKGFVAESEGYFRKALQKATRSNPNPLSGEYSLNLGISLFYQGKLNEAFDAFYKACWNQDSQAAAFSFMAQIKAKEGEKDAAIAFADEALIRNGRNFQAMNLKAYLTGGKSEALRYDPLNLVALFLAGEDIRKHLINPNVTIDLALELCAMGARDKALELLALDESGFPMVDYHKAYLTHDRADLEKAFSASPLYCFPNRIEDIPVLKYAIKANPRDFKAPYYLGCLFYDRERHEDAVQCFRLSIGRGADFPTPYRNLALLSYNVLKNAEEAMALMKKAFAMDETDARILYELDLLKKRTGVSPAERRKALEERMPLTESRDDLYLEYITLLNLTGDCEEALRRILSHRFHPWEGGEGKAPEQYIFSCLALGKIRDAFVYPENLGEGKLSGAQENRQNYLLGLSLGDTEEARDAFRKASTGISEPASAMYYNDQPPETIFYQGMALLKLGETEEAEKRFRKLVSYADDHIGDHVRIDYFAVSLPDLLVFDEDLDKKNRLHCLFMKALGLYGLGKRKESRELFEEALAENPNTFQIATHYRSLFGND